MHVAFVVIETEREARLDHFSKRNHWVRHICHVELDHALDVSFRTLEPQRSMVPESQDATKITYALADPRIYSSMKMMTLDMHMIAITICLSVTPSFSSSVVLMSTSKSNGVCMTNNSYREPILEDCCCKEEDECDSELESEDDGWSGTENHRCPLLDFPHHYFFGRLQLGFTKELDLARKSATCQFAIFRGLVERETITRHGWRDQVFQFGLDEWCYEPPFQSRYKNNVMR